MTQLDPEPTIFGTGRIDPLLAPDGSDEYQRAITWLVNRTKRLAFGAQLRVLLIGDPIAALNLRAAYQPLLDWLWDQAQPPMDETEYDDPMSNWSGNDA